MEKVYSVQFKKVGKKYYFAALDFKFAMGDFVVVETARGLEIGQIASDLTEISEQEIIDTLKPILRLANNEDLDQYLTNQEEAKKAFDICYELIRAHNLEMKLLNADYTLDQSKVVFYYTAEDRIDFRELLKDLSTKFKARIELRQIGYRDGAKLAGGLGVCGRELCCATHLTEFDTVSIKMAKNQELSLNPSKITGACSKLLCCIKYEDDLYTELRNSLVKVGEYVETPNSKRSKVTGLEVLKGRVIVLENDNNVTYDASEVKKLEKIEAPQKEVTSETKCSTCPCQNKDSVTVEDEAIETEELEELNVLEKEVAPVKVIDLSKRGSTSHKNKHPKKNFKDEDKKPFEKKNNKKERNFKKDNKVKESKNEAGSN